MAVGLSSSSFRDDLLGQLTAAEWQWLVSVSTRVEDLHREHQYNQTKLEMKKTKLETK